MLRRSIITIIGSSKALWTKIRAPCSAFGSHGHRALAALGAGAGVGRLSGGPARQVLLAQCGQCVHAFVAVVEAVDVMKGFAAGLQKCAAGLKVDFFQRLDAVAGKAGADRVHPRHAAARQFY